MGPTPVWQRKVKKEKVKFLVFQKKFLVLVLVLAIVLVFFQFLVLVSSFL